MTSETAVPVHSNLRDQRDFDKATRHSWLVFLLKGLLPLSAITVVMLFAGFAVLSYVPVEDVSVEGMGLDDGNLIMHQPKMAGIDKKGKPYAINAKKAIQSLTETGVVRLESIEAKLPVDANSTALIDADKGIYNSKKETLRLIDNVTVRGARGMDINLEEADIDIKTGNMVSQKPVTVLSGDTDISADSVIVEDNGERIIFKKRVKMTIKKPISGASVNPSKPSPDNKQ